MTMNAQAGGYPRPPTMLVIQQTQPMQRGSSFAQQSLRICSIVISIPLAIFLGAYGASNLSSGLNDLYAHKQANATDDDHGYGTSLDGDLDSGPDEENGKAMVIFGGILIVCCIMLIFYIKKQCRILRAGGDDEGGVLNPNSSPSPCQEVTNNPSQPCGVPASTAGATTALPQVSPSGFFLQPGGPQNSYSLTGHPAGFNLSVGGYSTAYHLSPGQTQPQPPSLSTPHDPPPSYSDSVGLGSNVAPPPASQSIPMNLPGMANGAYKSTNTRHHYAAPPPYSYDYIKKEKSKF